MVSVFPEIASQHQPDSARSGEVNITMTGDGYPIKMGDWTGG